MTAAIAPRMSSERAMRRDCSTEKQNSKMSIRILHFYTFQGYETKNQLAEPRTGGGVRVQRVLRAAAAEAPGGVQVPRVFAVAQRPPPPDALVARRPCACKSTVGPLLSKYGWLIPNACEQPQ